MPWTGPHKEFEKEQASQQIQRRLRRLQRGNQNTQLHISNKKSKGTEKGNIGKKNIQNHTNV